MCESSDKFWKNKQKLYRDLGHWWVTCAETRIRRFFQSLGKEKAYEFKQQESFYHACLYDLLRNSTDHQQLNVQIKEYKAKIVQLNGRKLRQIQAELGDNMVLSDEQKYIIPHHKSHQRRQKQLITEIKDQDGVMHTNIHGIRHTFYNEIKHRFLPIQVKTGSIDYMGSTLRRTITETDKKYMD